MRLTLRTMLACLDADDRLDPADAEELTQKIEQSKHATELAQRIRRVVQHPRLSSPRLDGKGMGLDPNSVGEYLDSTLAHDRIAEFERLCIASDIQLAEVAACHQILVLVLEQPVEIAPEQRDRIYRIGAESTRRTHEHPASEVRPGPDGTNVRIDRPAAETSIAAKITTPAATTAPVAPVQPKPLPEVPEYLRAGRKRSLWPLALAALLAFVVVGAGLRAMGPLDRTHPMAKLLGVSQEVAVLPSETPLVPAVPEQIIPSELPPAEVVRPEPPEDEVPVVPTDLEMKKNTLPDDNFPPDEPLVPMEPETKKNPPEEPPIPSEPEVKPVLPPAVDDLPIRKPVEPPLPQADVGRFTSENQVLARLDAEGRLWQRVPARASVFGGDRLVVFPAYRPQLQLATNVQVTFVGESRVTLGLNESPDVSVLDMEYGHMLVSSVGRTNAKLRLILAGVEGTISFGDADSELGVEVRMYLPPGVNPETPATERVVRLYATRGKVMWQEGPADAPGTVSTIALGEVRNYVANQPGETTKISVLPDWVEGKNVTEIDRRAAHDIEAKLSASPALELTLNELASEMERRTELRGLAVRALAQLDQFEPFVSVFNDENQRVYWTAEYDALRDALARGPETAAKVRETFVKLRGADDGENLYRMCWGYSPDDLRTAEHPAFLVRCLDLEALDYRVFAFENLRRITGSTQLYQPQFNAARRRTPVAQWTARLRGGEIVYKTPPAPINDPKPVAVAPMNTKPLEP
ncbi:MAG TPA: hypothetical protein VL096_08310 [Pirellulaceae bacterium]|nr:hypothetical protein [Pirellulaceae bacterium]